MNKAAGKIILFFDIVAVTVFCAIFILELTNVVLRYFFHSGIPQSNELAGYSLIVLTFLGMVRGFKEGTHVNFDLLTKTRSYKLNTILKSTSDTLTCILFVLLLIFSFMVSVKLYKAGLAGISVPWLPVWAVHAVIPIGFGASLMMMVLFHIKR